MLQFTPATTMPKQTSYKHLFWQVFKTAFAGVGYAGGLRVVPMSQYTLQTLSHIYDQWTKDKKSNE